MSRDNHNPLTSPFLSLSSANAGWEGLLVQAFSKPAQVDYWTTTRTPDFSLILFTGGVTQLEQRQTNSPWKKLYLHQGDLTLKPGGCPPSELRWKVLHGPPIQTLHLHLSTDLLAHVAGEMVGSACAHLSLQERTGFQDPLLAQIGFALWRDLKQDPSIGKLYVQTAAHLLIAHLLRHYTSARREGKEPGGGLTAQQIKRVVDFIQAHLLDDLSLDALAQQTGFSPYHFARLFRQATGESPHQFVLRQRVERAQHLLTEGRLSLAQIALESGFADQSYFTRIFKRYLGLTPRAYQRDREI